MNAEQFLVLIETIMEGTRAADIGACDSLSHLVMVIAVDRHLAVKLPTLQAYAAQEVTQIVDLATAAMALRRGEW